MSHDPAALALELEEARAAHAKLLVLISKRMRQCDALWRTAKPADRLLAVQRLVQTGALTKEQVAELEPKNERVRELMSAARTERKKLEKLTAEGKADADLKHRVFKLELDAQHAEQERDEIVDERDLRGPLYFIGETFVRTDPFTAEEPPLKDLATRAKALEEKLKELEPRKGARYTKTLPDGREKTLIRLLPALTAEGDSVND